MPALEYYTYDDYITWEGDWELIYGQAMPRHRNPTSMSPSPMISHQSIATRFIVELDNSIYECLNCSVIGEIDWKIDDCTTVKPDVVLICNEPNDKYITQAPKIIVEVISKSTAKRDEKIKFELWEKEKVQYYIIAYPDDCKAKIYKLINGKYDKQGDFTTQIYNFKDLDCKATINFDNVFKRFRK
jgi:Uma2 family endonuclease